MIKMFIIDNLFTALTLSDIDFEVDDQIPCSLANLVAGKRKRKKKRAIEEGGGALKHHVAFPLLFL